MKKTTALLLGLAGAAGVLAAQRLGLAFGADIRRYDRMRTMSGDGPLLFQIPTMVAGIFAAEGSVFPNLLALIVSLPSDALRYARMRSM